MPSDPRLAPDISEAHAEQLTTRMMRRQLALSLRVASVFILLLFGLPLVNYYAPQIANHPVFGFTLSWLILGVLVFPFAVLLSYYFVRNSDRIEDEIHQDIERENAAAQGGRL